SSGHGPAHEWPSRDDAWLVFPRRRDPGFLGRHSTSRSDARRQGMNPARLELLERVVDHEIVDSNGVPCGMVDDLELDGQPGAPLKVTFLLVGPGAWSARLPRLLGAIARRFSGDRIVRVSVVHIYTI